MRVRSRRLSLPGFVILFGTIALLVAACGTSGNTNQQGVPDAQQILRIPVNPGSNDIKTMDPALVQDVYSIVPVNLVFPGLIELDSHLKTVNYAASGVDVSTDGLTYTFHVRPGLKWSDGTPIDANAFAYAMNRSLDPCTASPVAYYLYEIKDSTTFNGETCSNPGTDAISGAIKTLIGDSIVASDAQTLQVTLTQPAAYFLEAMSYPTSYAVPQKLIDHDGIKNDTHWLDHLVDNGGLGGELYKVTTWDHAGHIVLQRNDAFWGAKPKLREIDITIYKDTTTSYNDYLTHKLDVGFPTGAQYPRAKTQADFHETGYLETDYFAMNWNDPPFNDLTMRQAFELALNKDQLANQVLHGIVTPTNHIVPQGMPGYNPNLTGVDGTTSLTGNPQKATQLEQAYVAAHCGGNAASCPKVVLTISSGSQDLLNEAQAAQQMWQSAFPGYPITIQTVEFNTLLSETGARKVQFWEIGWIADYPDPQDWLSLQFLPTAQYNNENVSDAQANTLMTKADADQNQTERLQLYEQAEQLMVNDVAWLPLDQSKNYWQVRSYVVNFNQDAQAYSSVVDQWPTFYIAKH